MKWLIYIYNRTTEETTRETLDFPDTKRCDRSFVSLEASKKFNVDEDCILVIPSQ